MEFFTKDKLEAIVTSNKNIGNWYGDLDKILPEYEIETKLRVAMFLAQTAWESTGYGRLIENLNYSKAGLLATFGKYFDSKSAANYARKPEKIANRVYANRLGNGSEASGDGWKYRGRGLIQCTGKSNYTECSQFLYDDDRLVQNPELLITVEGAIRSACWYWKTRDLNGYSDSSDVPGATKKINGGHHGLEGRKALYKKAMSVL